MNEMPDDEQGFDIEPAIPQQTAEPAMEPPAFLLTADKVRAVRFHPAKPGYEFRQVETFVDQVTETLLFLEAQLFQAQVDSHEKQEEIYDLQERVSMLTATIEVFRATGDPVTAADGSYLTESKAVEQSAELAAVTAERDSLVAQLAAAREDADRGWAAEAELRRYMDETLAPWLESQAAAGESSDAEAVEVAEPVDDVQAEEAVEELEVVVEAEPPADEDLPLEETELPAVVDDASYVEKLQQAVAALDEEGEDDDDSWSESSDADESAQPEEAVVIEEVVEDENSSPADSEEPIEEAVEPVSRYASTDDASDDWDVVDEADADVIDDIDEDTIEQAAAPGLEEPQAAPRLSILASSPEVAVLGDQAIIRDMPAAVGAGNGEAAPQKAGAPLPKLLASAPEVLAADPSVDQ